MDIFYKYDNHLCTVEGLEMALDLARPVYQKMCREREEREESFRIQQGRYFSAWFTAVARNPN